MKKWHSEQIAQNKSEHTANEIYKMISKIMKILKFNPHGLKVKNWNLNPSNFGKYQNYAARDSHDNDMKRHIRIHTEKIPYTFGNGGLKWDVPKMFENVPKHHSEISMQTHIRIKQTYG